MGKYSEALVAFDVAKKKHAMRSRKGAGREKSGFSGTLRTARPIEGTIKEIGGPIRSAACLF